MTRSSPKQVAGTIALPKNAKVQLTKWTANQPVTKKIRLTPEGKVEKVSTAAQLYEGQVSLIECSPAQFTDVLNKIGPNDCLSYGIPKNEKATAVTTQRKFEAAGKPVHMMPRTAEAMCWPEGTGIMLIDYDPEGDAHSPEKLRSILYDCCLAIETAGHVWAASTSSCLYDASGKEIKGIGGQRVYIFAADATDIPRAAAVLAKRTWLKGHGYIKVSKSGQLLERCVLDTAVFQTNRIDYCAPAICEKPLKQKKPKPQHFGNARLLLDTKVALPELTAVEETEYKRRVSHAKAAMKDTATEIRTRYIQERSAELVAQGIPEAEANKTISEAIHGQVLGPHFFLTTEEGHQVTVKTLLDDRKLWHGQRFADPLEPDYHNDHRIARAFLLGPGRPNIYSFAHGGVRYELTDRNVTIHLTPGERDTYMRKIVEVLQHRGELYRRAERMVAIRHDGTFEAQNDQMLLTLLDRSFRFESWSAVKNSPCACNAPLPLAKQILGSCAGDFPLVNTVVTAPILVPGAQRLIEATGFDEESGTYAMLPDDICQPVTTPTLDDVFQALGLLWSSVRLFPFVGPIDQTVVLTAMLTAVERPLLPTAPGFAFDAPVQGSGKSLLTKVLAELSGTEPVMSPHPGSQSDEEMRKTLFAKLLEGRRVIVFDNVIGDVDSASLAAVLTGKTYSDRLLQTSTSPQVPTNALILLSGNNMTLKGDLPRRILKCRIDPKSETPHQRQFAFNPDELVRAQRQQMVAAALTLFFGYLTLGKGAQYGKGRMASFEAWDVLIRQTVCWLADLQTQGVLPVGDVGSDLALPNLVDPMQAVNEAVQEDPALLQLGRFLDAWENQIGTGMSAATMFTVGNLIKTHGMGKSLPIGNNHDCPSVLEVLNEIAGVPRSSEISTRKLGSYFTSHEDRVFRGRALRRGGTYQGSIQWWVEEIRESGESTLPNPKANITPKIKGKGCKQVTKVTKAKATTAPPPKRQQPP